MNNRATICQSAKFLLIIGLCGLFSAGCTLSAFSPTPTPPPPTPAVFPTYTSTPTPVPTATRTPTATVSPTVAVLNNAPTKTPTLARAPISRQSDALPTIVPAPTDTPGPGIACVVIPGTLNLREGPGQNYRVISVLPAESNLFALKQIAGRDWLLATTARQDVGWVYASLLDCRDDLAGLPLAQDVLGQAPPTPVPATATRQKPTTPTATASATLTPIPPIPVGQWRGQYFTNASLLGEPVVTQTSQDIDFNWSLNSPAPGIPADNFSARWSGQFEFGGNGDYRFYVKADDGVRLYVDGYLIIDAWHTALPVDYFGDFADLSPGLHTVTVEYFESGGYAHIRVWAEEGSFGASHWHGKYYSNGNLQEPFKFIRNDGSIDFNWKNKSPDDQLSEDDFSIRWKRRVPLDFGDYKFFAEVEENDWVRASVDGWTIFEKQTGGDETVEGQFARLGGGEHTIEVEYKDHGGKAKIKFWWERQ